MMAMSFEQHQDQVYELRERVTEEMRETALVRESAEHLTRRIIREAAELERRSETLRRRWREEDDDVE